MVRAKGAYVALFLLGLSSFGAFALKTKNISPDNLLPYRQGKILIKVVEDAPEDALYSTEAFLGAIPIKKYTIVPGLSLYEFDESFDVQEAANYFLENEYVEYAEPDYLYTVASPNDPHFKDQWSLENTGQTGGTIDADINANSMWALQTGSKSVVIGIIDTGFDYNHNDLQNNIWTNSQEIPNNGIDEDGNGYIDDIHGINAITHTGNPLDDNAHGTHVSGTIGAVGNNGIGIDGVNQNVTLIACKFLDASGSGSTSDAITCLQYFGNLKTRAHDPINLVATNNSWGGTGNSTALSDAIAAHENLGILFIAAASNDGEDNDVNPHYPSNYNLSNVVSVAATDHKDNLASFSDYGKRTVHVGAPGVNIISTVPNNSYANYSGTSMATPHVTGLVGIIKASFPSLDYKQTKNLLLSSGTMISSLKNTTITGRRIRGADNNGVGALSCSNQTVASRLSPANSIININLGATVFLSQLRINCSAPLGNITLYTSTQETVTLTDTGVNGDRISGDGVYSLTWKPKTAQSYSLNFGGGDIVTVNVSSVQAPLSYAITSTAFLYETITGTSLGVGDESIVTVTSPFAIKFAGNSQGYTKLYVSSNGTISFTNNLNPGYLNRSLPVSQLTTLVTPYWDDLTPSGTNSNIYYATTGISPNRHFILEWRNMKQYNASGSGTFQVIFYEGSSTIKFNYLDTNFNNTSYNSGASATVGVQTSPSLATQYSYNSAVINSMTSLLLTIQ